MPSKVVIIGAGFSSLSAACFLQQYGFSVTVIDQHSTVGGRARQLIVDDAFIFDRGPSWYWMPDVFDQFFEKLGKRREDYYDLRRIQPSYRIYWEDGSSWDIPTDYPELLRWIEQEEQGASLKLEQMLEQAEKKYTISMREGLVYLSGLRLGELFRWSIWKNIWRFDLFRSVEHHIVKRFRSDKIRKWLSFPVLFLGATADKIPALYTMMNYADIRLGTWQPVGGMYKIVEAMYSIAQELGVEFVLNTEVQEIQLSGGKASGVLTSSGVYHADVVVSGADYHHTEQKLLPEPYRNYTPAYWEKRTFAPSSILYYIGLNKKMDNVQHHNLFFDENFDDFAGALYSHPHWSDKPLFYLNVPSQTDSMLAPEGKETLFILVPVATGLQGDSTEQRERYLDIIIQRIEEKTKQAIRPHILFTRHFGVQDFEQQYHSYKGNAYGLANTLLQTAHLKPKCRNKKIPNLFYTGQLTVPGPGVPPALMSGEIVAKLIRENYATSHE